MGELASKTSIFEKNLMENLGLNLMNDDIKVIFEVSGLRTKCR